MPTTLRDMNVSVLLRILPSSRTGGRLAGQAQVIETGETQVFADHDEMLVFLRHAAQATAAHPATDGRPDRSAPADRDQDGPDQDQATVDRSVAPSPAAG